MPLMTRIPSDLAAFGLRVETVPGWETRSAGSFAPAGVLCHWTAGPANSGTRPSLDIVVNGRPDLTGPLCNVYLDRNGTCVVVAAGRANHGGAGTWRGATGNSAFYGIEAEAANNADWTDAQRAAYPRLVAALLHGLGRGAEWAAGHSEYATPAGRKTDINGYPMNAMRTQIAAILANPAPQEDDMPLTDADVAKIWQMPIGEYGPPILRLISVVNAVGALLDRPAGKDVDTNALAAAVAPLLTANTRALTDADLHAVATAVADEQARRQAA